MHWHTSIAPRQPWTKKIERNFSSEPHTLVFFTPKWWRENWKDRVTLIPVWSLSNGPRHKPKKCWFCFWHPLNIKQRSTAVQSEHLKSTRIQFSLMSAWSLDPIESWMFPHHGYNWESATTLWLQREVKNKAVPSWVLRFHPLKAASQEDSGDLGSIAVLVQVDCPCWACWCTIQGGGAKILQWRVDLKQNKRNSLWSGFGFFSSAPTTAHALTRH